MTSISGLRPEPYVQTFSGPSRSESTHSAPFGKEHTRMPSYPARNDNTDRASEKRHEAIKAQRDHCLNYKNGTRLSICAAPNFDRSYRDVSGNIHHENDVPDATNFLVGEHGTVIGHKAIPGIGTCLKIKLDHPVEMPVSMAFVYLLPLRVSLLKEDESVEKE